jgi:hypothetical protein
MNVRTSLLPIAAAGALALGACGAPGSGNTSDGGDGGGGATAAAECTDVTLRLSHQWPEPAGEEGDFPNSTLSSATEQYDAMMNGSIDLSVFPLDYASGRVPAWSITLMPGLVRNHDDAVAWDQGEIGEAVEQNMLENGVVLLTSVWNAGAIGVKGDPVLRPEDVKDGMTMRAAGTYVERMLEAAGAGITSMASSEIYTAMQTGVLDAAVTSAGSFASYNLQEQVTSYTSPTTHTFWCSSPSSSPGSRSTSCAPSSRRPCARSARACRTTPTRRPVRTTPGWRRSSPTRACRSST